MGEAIGAAVVGKETAAAVAIIAWVTSSKCFSVPLSKSITPSPPLR